MIKLLICGKNVLKETPINKIHKVYIKENFKDNTVLTYIKENKIRYEIVPEFRLNKMTKERHQGIILDVDDYEYYKLEDAYQDDFVVLLDHLEDPHNLGAILRSVDAFGYDAVILPKNRSCSITETVAHVSTGAIEHIKIAYINSLSTFVIRLKEKGYWICGTDASGDTEVSTIDPNLDLAVIIGSEGFGMSRTLVKQTDFLLSIPMVGHVNSLNASVSAGIVL